MGEENQIGINIEEEWLTEGITAGRGRTLTTLLNTVGMVGMEVEEGDLVQEKTYVIIDL